MKRRMIFIARLTPFILVVFLLIYLTRINAGSEVYLKVHSNYIQFNTAKESPLFESGLFVDSIKFRNVKLIFDAKKISNVSNDSTRSENLFPAIMGPENKHIYNEVTIKDDPSLYIKKFTIPPISVVTITKTENALKIGVRSDSVVKGLVSYQDVFSFYGRNNKLMQNSLLFENETFKVIPDAISKNMEFRGSNDFQMEIYMDFDTLEQEISPYIQMEISDVLLYQADNFSNYPNNRSTLQMAELEISGPQLFQPSKTFPIYNSILGSGDFIVLKEGDVYDFRIDALEKDHITIDMYSNKATDVKTGKRYRYLHSVFPSVLDYAINEPSKNTLWAILVFVITQFFLVKRNLTGIFSKTKRKKKK